MSNTVKLNDKVRGTIHLNVVDGKVVGALGSEPERYVGLSVDAAKHLARYGGLGRAWERKQAPSAAGPRETEVITALDEAHGLLGSDAFEAAAALLDELETPANYPNGDHSPEVMADIRAAARRARDYAREQIEADIEDGALSEEEIATWERLQAL